MEKKLYLKELQVYSGIAIIFVVLIHSNGNYLKSLDLMKYADTGELFHYIDYSHISNTIFPMIYNLIDKLIHIAVPIFIFLAGYKYKMNDSKLPYKSLLTKKYKQIFRPFFYVSLFILLYHWLSILFNKFMLHNYPSKLLTLPDMLKDFLKIFLGYNYAYQLWYIPLYFFIVLSYPIISKSFKNDKFRITFFILLALVSVVLDAFVKFYSLYPYPLSFIYYFYLYELGSIFYKYNLKSHSGNFVIITYTIMLLLSIFIRRKIANIMFSEILIIPLGVIAFYYISLKLKNSTFLLYMGKYSFYIFLFHEPIFVTGITNLLLRLNLYKSYFIVIFVLTISIILSICFYKILISTCVGKFIFNKSYSAEKR